MPFGIGRNNFFLCTPIRVADQTTNREVSEWLKEHAWKVCILQKGIEGSNPFLSATKKALNSLN